ncbi:Dus1l [Nucleospora cyclopteri]
MESYSDEAFRILVRRYKADLCYTEMVHSKNFNASKCNPQKNYWYTTDEHDRPLVIQICGNNPQEMLKTCLKVQNYCDAIDINFGCPQNIAKKGNYGAFLMEDYELAREIVSTLSKNIKVPLFCKIRVFESIDKTVEFAKMLENNGCALMAVHGRTKEQKKQNTGYVSLNHIKAVKMAVKIPVVSNGGVLEHSDIEKTIKITNCDGIMIAEPALFIPTIFTPIKRTCIELLEEYLTIVKENPTKTAQRHVKGHVFKFLRRLCDYKKDLNEEISKCRKIEDYFKLLDLIRNNKDLIPEYLLETKPYIRKEYLNSP